MTESIGFKKFPNASGEYWLDCPKRIRVYLAGQLVADSRYAKIFRGFPAAYYFPKEDIEEEYLIPTDKVDKGKFGERRFWTVKVGEKESENAAWEFIDPPSSGPDVKGYITFEWEGMDHWFEEDEPVYVEPRDPYTRIDMRQSSRKVKVIVEGKTIAESDRPVLLFETGAVTRFYLYRSDVRMDLLELTEKHTGCPYKGIADYFSVHVGDEVKENVVWTYPYPNPQCARIQNLICFYSEKLEEFYVDGELLHKGK